MSNFTWALIAALRGKSPGQSQKCDGCEGTFEIEDMNPCSADIWLCVPCLDRYFRQSQEAADSEKREPGRPAS